MVSNFRSKFTASLEKTMLTAPEKDIIVSRYLDVVDSAERDYFWIRVFYIVFNNIITVSGVFIASIAALDFSNSPPSVNAGLKYTIMVLGILLTLSNKLIHLFNIDKKHVVNKTLLEKLHSEGWCFLSGINAYGTSPCDDWCYRFKMFCTRIELIKVKATEASPEMENNGVVAEILATSPNGSSRRATIMGTYIARPEHVVNISTNVQ